MNHMNEVAKMLGVELGEEFEIEGDVFNPYRVTSQGLSDTTGSINNCTLLRLLTGSDEIVKKPWKPKEREKYFHVMYNGNVDDWFYHESSPEVLNYKIGNCFHPCDEITSEIIEKYVNFFNSDKQIQI